MSTITVRGVEYTATQSLEENKITFKQGNVDKQFNALYVGVSLPLKEKDVTGALTGASRYGSLTVEYNEETSFEGVYSSILKGVIKSSKEDYETYYDRYEGKTGPNVHMAALNAIGRKEIGKADDQAVFFNSIKGFEPMQPIIYDINEVAEGISITLVDVPESGTIMYSLDNFETTLPLDGDIKLVEGVYTIGLVNSEDGYPFFKTFTVSPEQDDNL